MVVHTQWGARWESEENDSAAAEWPERRKEFRNPTDSCAHVPHWVQAWHHRLEGQHAALSTFAGPVKHVG